MEKKWQAFQNRRWGMPATEQPATALGVCG